MSINPVAIIEGLFEKNRNCCDLILQLLGDDKIRAQFPSIHKGSQRIAREPWKDKDLQNAVTELFNGTVQAETFLQTIEDHRAKQQKLRLDVGPLLANPKFYAKECTKFRKYFDSRMKYLDLKHVYVESPLLTAANEGLAGLARVVLSSGVSPDILAEGFGERTALQIASDHGHAHIVKMLLDRGAAVDRRTMTGCTPLYLAAARGNHACVKVLLDSGANRHHTDDWWGNTPLNVAASKEVVELLQQ